MEVLGGVGPAEAQMSLGGQAETPDCAFTDTAEVERAVALNGVGDLSKARRRTVLEVSRNSPVHVEANHKAVALRSWLEKLWQPRHHLSQEWMR